MGRRDTAMSDHEGMRFERYVGPTEVDALIDNVINLAWTKCCVGHMNVLKMKDHSDLQ